MRLLADANRRWRLWAAPVVRGMNVRSFQALGGEGTHLVTPGAVATAAAGPVA